MKTNVLIKTNRQAKNLKIKDLAQLLNIDSTLISRFENGDRLPTRVQIHDLSDVLNINFEELYVAWLKDQIYQNIGNDYLAARAIMEVHEEMQFYGSFVREPLSEDMEKELKIISTLKSDLETYRNLDSFRVQEALALEYTHESNKIEGNTLSLKETDLVINEGITVSGKSMREHLEAINHHEAIAFVKDLAQPNYVLKPRDLLQLHQLILRGIYPTEAGKYRKVQVMIQGSAHMPPAPYLIEKEMEEYFIWYNKNRKVLHPVVLAAEMHERLVTIHPFIDGNGRTSRLIMNLILIQNGYVIANIKGDYDSRMSYYKALEKCQTEGNKEDFIDLIIQTEKKCLERYLKILSA